jgi:hypothetical protein
VCGEQIERAHRVRQLRGIPLLEVIGILSGRDQTRAAVDAADRVAELFR